MHEKRSLTPVMIYIVEGSWWHNDGHGGWNRDVIISVHDNPDDAAASFKNFEKPRFSDKYTTLEAREIRKFEINSLTEEAKRFAP